MGTIPFISYVVVKGAKDIVTVDFVTITAACVLGAKTETTGTVCAMTKMLGTAGARVWFLNLRALFIFFHG